MLSKYYQDSNVRARLCDFLGGYTPDQSPTVYITGESTNPELSYTPRPASTLWSCLDQGLDVGRSLWDRAWLIAHLDFEYVNFDHPSEPYLNPQRTLGMQSPIVEAASEILRSYGIRPLRLMSGRGHHLVWKISRQSDAYGRLAWLGHLDPTTRERYRQPRPPHDDVVGETLGSAYAGLGMVVEYLSHEIMRRAIPSLNIPIQLTAVEVGPGQYGREIVSIDISEYGDPIDTRVIRIPFSAYLKTEQQRYLLGDSTVDRLPRLFLIPQETMGDDEAASTMRDPSRVADLARYASTSIPDQSSESLGLIDAYARSDLARFHDAFYEDDHDPPESWPDTYDRTPLDDFPFCVRSALSKPNDVLMKPAAIQLVVRTMLAVGWRPRHIAGLIRSKYERDHGWGDRWYTNDASMRADFYVRMFSGLLHTGLDSLIDYNCVSMQEKGYCRSEDCGGSLIPLREALMRKNDERVARWDFDRVLL